MVTREVGAAEHGAHAQPVNCTRYGRADDQPRMVRAECKGSTRKPPPASTACIVLHVVD